MSTPPLEILYEDNHLLVVRKSAGALVQGDRTGDPTLLDAAKAYLKEKYRKPGEVFLGIVHRLDRPVGGVLVFARTSKAASRLGEQFRSRAVDKVYWAVVEGAPEPPEGRMEDWLRRDHMRSRVSAPDAPGAQHAALSYRSVESRGGWTLVEIRLETGRHHQIRVQFASRGHPILGDRRYGSRDAVPSGHIALMARALTLTHPTQGTRMTFTASLPEDWPWSDMDNRVLI